MVKHQDAWGSVCVCVCVNINCGSSQLDKNTEIWTMDGQAVYDQEDRVIGAFEGCKQVVVSPTQNAFSKLNSANTVTS